LETRVISCSRLLRSSTKYYYVRLQVASVIECRQFERAAKLFVDKWRHRAIYRVVATFVECNGVYEVRSIPVVRWRSRGAAPAAGGPCRSPHQGDKSGANPTFRRRQRKLVQSNRCKTGPGKAVVGRPQGHVSLRGGDDAPRSSGRSFRSRRSQSAWGT
jgi:hypothetical protein